jgi:hypothetical protein
MWRRKFLFSKVQDHTLSARAPVDSLLSFPCAGWVGGTAARAALLTGAFVWRKELMCAAASV